MHYTIFPTRHSGRVGISDLLSDYKVEYDQLIQLHLALLLTWTFFTLYHLILMDDVWMYFLDSWTFLKEIPGGDYSVGAIPIDRW